MRVVEGENYRVTSVPVSDDLYIVTIQGTTLPCRVVLKDPATLKEVGWIEEMWCEKV